MSIKLIRLPKRLGPGMARMVIWMLMGNISGFISAMFDGRVDRVRVRLVRRVFLGIFVRMKDCTSFRKLHRMFASVFVGPLSSFRRPDNIRVSSGIPEQACALLLVLHSP
jgi:hypothetical protein